MRENITESAEVITSSEYISLINSNQNMWMRACSTGLRSTCEIPPAACIGFGVLFTVGSTLALILLNKTLPIASALGIGGMLTIGGCALCIGLLQTLSVHKLLVDSQTNNAVETGPDVRPQLSV